MQRKRKHCIILEKSMEELPTIPFQLAEFVDQSHLQIKAHCHFLCR